MHAIESGSKFDVEAEVDHLGELQSGSTGLLIRRFVEHPRHAMTQPYVRLLPAPRMMRAGTWSTDGNPSKTIPFRRTNPAICPISAISSLPSRNRTCPTPASPKQPPWT
jgi:hypothetical protein